MIASSCFSPCFVALKQVAAVNVAQRGLWSCCRRAKGRAIESRPRVGGLHSARDSGTDSRPNPRAALADGKTMTVAVKGTIPSGQRVDGTNFYDKQ
jgi:hypothetical protein